MKLYRMGENLSCAHPPQATHIPTNTDQLLHKEVCPPTSPSAVQNWKVLKLLVICITALPNRLFPLTCIVILHICHLPKFQPMNLLEGTPMSKFLDFKHTDPCSTLTCSQESQIGEGEGGGGTNLEKQKTETQRIFLAL